LSEFTQTLAQVLDLHRSEDTRHGHDSKEGDKQIVEEGSRLPVEAGHEVKNDVEADAADYLRRQIDQDGSI
jgi:hypothetical protein